MNFHIGDYQACAKRLKDRKGRVLSADDITYYHRIVIALHESIRLMSEIDEKLIEAYRGTVSLPFKAGKHGRAAVKIVDDRGIESLKIVELELAT